MNKRTQKPHTRGAALLIFIILFLVASAALVYGVGRGAYQDIVWYRTLESSKETFFAAEAAAEDAIYRHRSSESYSNTESFTIGDAAVAVSRTFSVDRFTFDITAEAFNTYRNTHLELVLGDGASFSFGLQSDTGGIRMENSSGVIGNIYSNGTVVGTGGGSGNLVTGSIISAGPGGFIDGVHATGSVWAHTINDSWVEGDAHYYATSTLTASVVDGTKYPGSPDQATSALPVSDSVIDDWKDTAEAGGIISSSDPRCAGGTWVIDSSTTTNATKIECNVYVDKSGTTWTLQGPIWIEGDLTTKSGPTIEIDNSIPDLEGKSIQIIVDNESNRSSSSRVVLQNSAIFNGYGDGSYILLLSQNTDEETGGPEAAITSNQSAAGDVLLYAGHGEILIEQSGQFVGVAALLIRLRNSAQIIYETGAVSLEFPSGPGGGYIIGRWDEVK